MIRTSEPQTEKILVTPSTKQDLMALKLPEERFGDVVTRLVQEKKKQDYIAHLLEVAKNGDFVHMDSDDEYVQIRDEVNRSAPRD